MHVSPFLATLHIFYRFSFFAVAIVQEALQNSPTKHKNTEGAASSTPVHDLAVRTWGIHIVMRSFLHLHSSEFSFRAVIRISTSDYETCPKNHQQRNYEKSVGELLQPPDGIHYYERQS